MCYWKAAIQEIGLFKISELPICHRINPKLNELHRILTVLSLRAESAPDDPTLSSQITRIQAQIATVENTYQQTVLEHRLRHLEHSMVHPLTQIKELSKKQWQDTPLFLIQNGEWTPTHQAFTRYYQHLFNHECQSPLKDMVSDKVQNFCSRFNRLLNYPLMTLPLLLPGCVVMQPQVLTEFHRKF